MADAVKRTGIGKLGRRIGGISNGEKPRRAMMFQGEVLDIGATVKDYFETYHAWVPTLVFGAFTLTNSFRILAYLPQIVKAASDTNGATAISSLTWGLFLASHVMTVAYALVCLGDLVLALIFVGNAAACLAIVLITVVKRRQHRMRNAALRSPAAE